MKMRYFITGATGFIGSNVVRRLLQNNEEVHILTRKELNWRLSDVTSNIHIHQGDILSPSLASTLKDISPTIIFHFAAYGAMPQEKDLNAMIDVNIKGLHHLLTSLPSSVELFVNSGSSSEYGNKDVPMTEEMMLEPINDYGVTKASATLYSQHFSKNAPYSLVTLRLFSPYGPYEQPSRFIPYVISRVLQKKNLQLSSPLFVRDFIYLDDVVDAYIRSVIHKEQLGGQIINIGSGKQYSLEDVVHTVEKLFEGKPDISWDTTKKQERQKEPSHWQADISKAQQLLGWKPQHTLRAGLEKTGRWIQDHLSLYES